MDEIIGHRRLADSTLLHMKKSELIEYIRCLEHNWSVTHAQVMQQSALLNQFIGYGADNLGAALNCAIRYAAGRRSYMPSLLIDFITPLLPWLTTKTLNCFLRDIQQAEENGGLGDACDVKDWKRFSMLIKKELDSRNV